MVVALSLFVLPLIVRVANMRRAPSLFELLLFHFVAAIAIIALWMATLDCAQLFYTAFVVPDFYLAAGLITLPLSLLAFWKIRLDR